HGRRAGRESEGGDEPGRLGSHGRGHQPEEGRGNDWPANLLADSERCQVDDRLAKRWNPADPARGKNESAPGDHWPGTDPLRQGGWQGAAEKEGMVQVTGIRDEIWPAATN